MAIFKMGRDDNTDLHNLQSDSDIISAAIGEYGRWQCLMTFLLSFYNITCTFHIFAPTFLSADRPIRCSQISLTTENGNKTYLNWTQPIDYCSTFIINSTALEIAPLKLKLQNYSAQCSKWKFEGEGSTIISEFQLICDRSPLNDVSEMMFLIGVAFGGLVCGIISDRYGRKKTLVLSVAIQLLVGIGIAFVRSFGLYLFLRTILGFISVSIVFSGFVLCIEIVGGAWKTVAGICYLFPVSLGYMVIACIAWFIRDWRRLQIAISLPGVLLLLLTMILPESPRWLLAAGRTKDVLQIVSRATAFNKMELSSSVKKQILAVDDNVSSEELGTLSQLFRTKHMRKITFLNWTVWLCVYFIYYGLTLNLNNMGGNLYLNAILVGAVEIPAVAASIFILLRVGRRWPLALSMIISGIACFINIILSVFKSSPEWTNTMFTMISKLSISASNVIIPVFTAELYPTCIRNIGVGASNISSGVALLIVPYLWQTVKFYSSFPMVILTMCGIIGGISVLFLPETNITRSKSIKIIT